MATVAQPVATRRSGSSGWLAVLAIWHVLLSIAAAVGVYGLFYQLVGAYPVAALAHCGFADPRDACQRRRCLLTFFVVITRAAPFR